MSGPENFDPIDVALRVAHAVDVCQGAYFVGGSLASSLHGEPTATNCIDMVLDLPIGRIKHFVNELRGDFAVDSDTLLRDTFLRGEVLQRLLSADAAEGRPVRPPPTAL